MNVEIHLASERDTTAVTEILSRAVSRKVERGDFLWGGHPFSLDEAKSLIDSKSLYVALADEAICGTVQITQSDERIWGDDDSGHEALYAHKLATSDEVRGQNVGGKILDLVAKQAATDGKIAVRLDCSYANKRLCKYYEQQGFTQVQHREIPHKNANRNNRSSIYQVALFQRSVT